MSMAPGGGRRRRVSHITPAVQIVVGLTAIFLLSIGSVRFAPASSEVAAWWPAAGVAVLLAAKCSGRVRVWVTVGIFVVSVVGNFVAGRMLDVSVGFAFANTAEAFVGARLLRGRDGRLFGFDSVSGLVRVLVVALTCGLVAALLAGFTVIFFTAGDFFATVSSVLPSHGAAILLITPLGLRVMDAVHQARWFEVVAQWVILFACLGVVFGTQQSLAITFVPFAVLVWGATRLTLRGFQLQMLAMAIGVAALSRLGRGPFAVGPLVPEFSASLVQSYLVSSCLVFFSLAVLVGAQRQSAAALGSSEELFRESFSNALVGMAIAVRSDRGLRVERANRVASEILQLVDGGQIDPLRVFTDSSAGALSDATPLVRRGESEGWRSQLETLAGKVIDVYVAPLTSAGSDRRYAIQFADVSEKAMAERALLRAIEYERKAGARLRVLDSVKDSLISSVSHELRTPLAGILGYSEMLLDGDAGPLSEDQADMIRIVERSGRRLSRIVEDLLTMSQIDSSASRAGSVWLDPAAVVRAVGAELRPLADAKGHHFAVLANASGGVGIRAVPDDVHKVVTNLVGNAIKYTLDGGTIRAVVRDEADMIHIDVIDSGVGIAPDDQQKVFGQFYRANSGDDAPAGTGLGLAIVDALARRNGAVISVDSALGVGTRMTVSFVRVVNSSAGVGAGARQVSGLQARDDFG